MKEAFSTLNQTGFLPFRPIPGCTSRHAQTILGNLILAGQPPPSKTFVVQLADGDHIYGGLSTPLSWQPGQKTIVMIHGLNGTQSSNYMVRIGRKLYAAGYQVLRLNLRGCGQNAHLAKKPYHAGTSQDVLEVIEALKKQCPQSPLLVVGFSLGGNIALKLASELDEKNRSVINATLAICPPIDLARSIQLINRPHNRLYHQYYVKGLQNQGHRWLGGRKIKSLVDFDNVVTAPCWGFKDASDYYQQCSSRFILPAIQTTPCHVLFAKDDPFVDSTPILSLSLPCVKVFLAPYGGHMGFLGWSGGEHRYLWMDYFVMNWIRQAGAAP